MSFSVEALKVIRAAHRVSLAASFAGVVLLMAPKGTDYGPAIEELELLRSLDTRNYEQQLQWILGTPPLLPQHPDHPYQGAATVPFLRQHICCLAPIDLRFFETQAEFDYEPAPLGRPLAEWLSWVGSTEPAKVILPNWAEARINVDTNPADREAESMLAPSDYRTVRFFYVAPTGDNYLVGSRYSFMAFLENGLDPPIEEHWWELIVADKDLALFDDKWRAALADRGRSVVQGFVPGGSPSAIPFVGVRTGSISWWLSSEEELASLVPDSALRLGNLPRLQEHWTEVAKMTLPEAAAFMGARQKELREIPLFGIKIPGALCLILVPLTFLLSHLYMLIHILQLAREGSISADPPLFPWIGIYKELMPRILSAGTVTVLPLLVCSGLVIRYGDRVGHGTSAGAILLGASAMSVGWLVLNSTRRVIGESELPTKVES